MPDVICNTSPLQYLHQVGELHLLQALASRVVIPPAVVTEIEAGRALPQLPINNATWKRSQRLAFDLRHRSVTPPATDVLIASAAQENRTTLVHADRHFELIATKTALETESWIKSVPSSSKRARR